MKLRTKASRGSILEAARLRMRCPHNFMATAGVGRRWALPHTATTRATARTTPTPCTLGRAVTSRTCQHTVYGGTSIGAGRAEGVACLAVVYCGAPRGNTGRGWRPSSAPCSSDYCGSSYMVSRRSRAGLIVGSESRSPPSHASAAVSPPVASKMVPPLRRSRRRSRRRRCCRR